MADLAIESETVREQRLEDLTEPERATMPKAGLEPAPRLRYSITRIAGRMLLGIVAQLAAATLAAGPSAAQVPGCVLFYEDADLGGKHYQACGAGNHWLPDYPDGINWHYRVSSFQCGADVEGVTFVDGNRVHESSRRFSCPGTYNLAQFDDKATNVEVVGSGCVTLYEGANRQGALYRVCGQGDHWLP